MASRTNTRERGGVGRYSSGTVFVMMADSPAVANRNRTGLGILDAMMSSKLWTVVLLNTAITIVQQRMYIPGSKC